MDGPDQLAVLAVSLEARKPYILCFCAFCPFSVPSAHYFLPWKPLEIQLCLTVLLSTVPNRGLYVVRKEPTHVSKHATDEPHPGAPGHHSACVVHVGGRRFPRTLMGNTSTPRQEAGNPFRKPSFLVEQKEGMLTKNTWY